MTINPGDEFAKRSQEYGQKLSGMTLEYYRLSEQTKAIANRLKELDLLIIETMSAAHVNDKAAREFDTYLAVEKGAVTLEDIDKGVRATGKGKG